MFVDRHGQPDVVEDRGRFLKIMGELKPYMVEFNEDGIMKNKEYPLDCAVSGGIRQPIIKIIYDECTFSTNNSICKAWTRIGDTFLWPKGGGQGIMVFEFLLPFDRLNLLSLSEEKQKEMMEKTELTILKAVKLFEYGKNNEGYWNRAKLHKQAVSKALLIT